MSSPVIGLSTAQQMPGDDGQASARANANGAQSASDQDIVQQMIADGSMPDVAADPPSPAPMRAVVAAAATTNPDVAARTQRHRNAFAVRCIRAWRGPSCRGRSYCPGPSSECS